MVDTYLGTDKKRKDKIMHSELDFSPVQIITKLGSLMVMITVFPQIVSAETILF
jgi:hypothetical protein